MAGQLQLLNRLSERHERESMLGTQFDQKPRTLGANQPKSEWCVFCPR